MYGMTATVPLIWAEQNATAYRSGSGQEHRMAFVDGAVIPGKVHFTREQAEGLSAASHVCRREDAAHNGCKRHQAPGLELPHSPVDNVTSREAI